MVIVIFPSLDPKKNVNKIPDNYCQEVRQFGKSHAHLLMHQVSLTSRIFNL